MAEGGGAPPAEAMRGGKGVSAVVAAVIGIVLFVAGFGVGSYIFPQAPPPQGPKLLLGTNTEFIPFEYYDNVTDQLVGFDVELIQTMVTRSGYTYEWRDFTDFDALLFAVAAEGVDIAVGAITQNAPPPIGTERNASMDFTLPYFEADQGVLKKKTNPTNYCAAADCTVSELNQAGLRVGAQETTTSEFWACDNLPAVADCSTPTTEAGDNLFTFPAVAQVLQALNAGTVDIVIMDLPAAQGSAGTDFEVDGAIQTNELYGFAVPEGDPKDILERLNTALTGMRQDGTYARILDKYF